ncbi:MAG: hypothetical protein L3J66_00400 [Bacteroidales bacterium]|nr:hypothetical protein [Bacteroidales bacterium]
MLILVISSFSREVEMPDGAYKTTNGFLNNTPLFINQFAIVKRNEGKISDFGGSMFKVVPTDKSLKREFIKWGLWGVVWKDTLYISNSKFSFNPGYNQIDYLGDHFVLFMSNVVVEDELRKTEWLNVREKIDFILLQKGRCL